MDAGKEISQRSGDKASIGSCRRLGEMVGEVTRVTLEDLSIVDRWERTAVDAKEGRAFKTRAKAALVADKLVTEAIDFFLGLRLACH